MRRVSYWIALIFILTFAPPARAQDHSHHPGFYFGGWIGGTIRSDTPLEKIGVATQKTEFEPGYTLGAFLGYNFGNNFRAEWEIGYRENVLRTGEGKDPQAGTSAIMINGFYDYHLNPNLELYAGGGLGVATSQLETISLGNDLDESEDVFAYQLEAGVAWDISKTLHFTIGYRFFNSADPEFRLDSGEVFRMNLTNQEILLKMRYLFKL
ncbi:MAG: outer membrane beta-barrel protein [Nitrospinaceae bacterium]|nr:porin family protein [Nitrospinaceae bacterium]NIR55879.1 porin family protein [Nitrospinaceae bacterium]NIS86331.1 porin family protein [Nitrospinaceae bacterium]NIT83161.1 porin family protein [Nitrospinaceae bacterium]NIU45370.1 porin family protein [Nitrospinaceae bacterium]